MLTQPSCGAWRPYVLALTAFALGAEPAVVHLLDRSRIQATDVAYAAARTPPSEPEHSTERHARGETFPRVGQVSARTTSR